ncbi:MAG: VOC family protein [Candidatus Hodarchaeales archaeon]|jgi:predicted enzyme related to lactoylglutathione lyase
MTDVSRIEAVMLESSNPERLLEFYQSAFNITEMKWLNENHVGFNFSNAYFAIDRIKTPDKGRGRTAIWFKVKNVRKTYQKFVLLGGEEIIPPSHHKDVKTILAKIYDLDKNIIGLIQEEE